MSELSQKTVVKSKKSTGEQMKERLRNLRRHLDNVRNACFLLAERLVDREEDGDYQLALRLVRNSLNHDRSKLEGLEWEFIHQKDDQVLLGIAARHHANVNAHHPEYWGGQSFMPPDAVAEMVCDWFARSQEMGTSLRQWIKDEAFKRYDIPPTGRVSKLVKGFVDLLLEPLFKDKDTL